MVVKPVLCSGTFSGTWRRVEHSCVVGVSENGAKGADELHTKVQDATPQ
jgi:hypothetical protein